MELVLKRLIKTEKSTIGELSINGAFECYTLEDAERISKVYGRTAIPKGQYEVIINYSNRFKQYMPLLLNVPDYEGVRIHSGNTANDTLGCILVGQKKGVDVIGASRLAYKALFNKMKAVEKKEKIFITIQ
jgi:hypothetical protein